MSVYGTPSTVYLMKPPLIYGCRVTWREQQILSYYHRCGLPFKSLICRRKRLVALIPFVKESEDSESFSKFDYS
jgi:hypothetical protein